MTTTFEKRRAAETAIVNASVRALLAAGFMLGVDLEDEIPEQSDNRESIVDDAMSMDEARVYVFRRGETEYFGWLFFVYGNDGWDVLADHTTNLSQYIDVGDVKETIARHEKIICG